MKFQAVCQCHKELRSFIKSIIICFMHQKTIKSSVHLLHSFVKWSILFPNFGSPILHILKTAFFFFMHSVIQKLVWLAVPCMRVHFVTGRANIWASAIHDVHTMSSHHVDSHLQTAHMWKKFCEHNSRSAAQKKYALHDSFQQKNSKNLAVVVVVEDHTGALLVFPYCRSITVFSASGFCLSSLCQLCVMPNMLQLQSSKNCP